jgi:putative oxidoreductase
MTNLFVAILDRADGILARVPAWFVSLLARIAVATPFWRSVQTKISGGELFGQSWKFWNVSESTFLLFRHEYALPLLPVNLAAYSATYAEFFLSIAIVLGLLTRLSALGVLLMTAVIQLFVYPDAWNVHILWAALLIYLIRYGGGHISIDHLMQMKKREISAN